MKIFDLFMNVLRVKKVCITDQVCVLILEFSVCVIFNIVLKKLYTLLKCKSFIYQNWLGWFLFKPSKIRYTVLHKEN